MIQISLYEIRDKFRTRLASVRTGAGLGIGANLVGGFNDLP